MNAPISALPTFKNKLSKVLTGISRCAQLSLVHILKVFFFIFLMACQKVPGGGKSSSNQMVPALQSTSLASPAQATPYQMGGDSSGGGELITDKNNPWFIQNTKSVNYCIKIDKDHFSLPVDRVRAAILKSIEYWHREFENYNSPDDLEKHKASFILGTQKFNEVTCGPQADLTFQFGILDDEQKNHLPSYKNFAAFSVRTSYDPVSLKGRGFIYVAADSGDMKPSILKNDHQSDWNHGNVEVLSPVLIHEMGHVYGLLHSGEPGTLMNAGFPQRQLEQFGWLMQNISDMPHFLKASSPLKSGIKISTGVCQPHDQIGRFFYASPNFLKEQTSGEKYIYLRPTSTGIVVYEVTRSYDDTNEKKITELGHLENARQEEPLSHANLIQLYVTPSQKVINWEYPSWLEHSEEKFQVFANYSPQKIILNANYESVKFEGRRSFRIDISPSGIEQISGVLETGELISDVCSRQP